jgi:RNA polymerase sigma-B factor
MASTLSRPRALGPAALRRRNQRVEASRNLVRPIALHYAGCTGECAEDLLQVGLLGLIRAAELYRVDRAVPFEAFARPHVRGAILHYLRDASPGVRLPRRQAELQCRLVRLEDRLRSEAGKAPDPEELRRALGLTAEQWQRLVAMRQFRRTVPLEAEGLTLPAVPSPEPVEELCRSRQRVEQLLEVLDHRQRRAVQGVVLAGLSYRRLGKEMGVSPMTVQRLLRRGLDRLRDHLEGGGLSPRRPVRHAASAARGC